MAAKDDRDPVVGGARLSKWRHRLAAPKAADRVDALTGLAGLEKRAVKAVPLLLEALDDRSRDVRRSALRALSSLEFDCPDAVGPAAEPAVPQLIEFLRHAEMEVRLDAVRVLGCIGPPAASAASQIANLLERAEGEVEASHVANVLPKLGRTAVPHLIAALGNPRPHVRWSAAFGLGSLGPSASEAIPVLINALNDPPPTRTFAVMSLGKIGTGAEQVVPALIRMLDDDEYEARRAAIASLGEFGSAARAAVPRLIQFVQQADLTLGFDAAEALGKIGPPAFAALEPLKGLLTSEYRRIREEAQYAIHAISGTPIPADEAERRKKPGPGDSLFDFARTKQVVAAMLNEGLAKFGREHPAEVVACVAIFSRGFSAEACLCIGTPDEVPADLKHGGAYGFKYPEYSNDHFEWWPDLYKVGPSFTIKLPDGTLIHRSTDKNGNEAIDKPLFNLLVEILAEALPFKGLKLAKSYRVGVEMHDSPHIKFWRPG